MTELLYPFHAANASGQFWAQQPSVSRLVRQPPNSGELLINRVGGQTSPFQEDAVANHDDAIESQAGLRAVPCDELLDGVLVDAARSRAAPEDRPVHMKTRPLDETRSQSHLAMEPPPSPTSKQFQTGTNSEIIQVTDGTGIENLREGGETGMRFCSRHYQKHSRYSMYPKIPKLIRRIAEAFAEITITSGPTTLSTMRTSC